MSEANLGWRDEEICSECWHWPLTTVLGSGADGLPMEYSKDEFLTAVSGCGGILGLQGATGSGKTMLAPEYLLTSLYRYDRRHPCVCLVQDSVFSARQVVASLVDVFRWRRDRIHLRTSGDTEDNFSTGWTQLSVINYGILWKWLEGGHAWTERYGGIILDEFAHFTPLRELAARTVFQQLKAATLKGSPFHIVATSASLTPGYLKHIGDLNDGEFQFMVVDTRKHAMERCMLIPLDQHKILESMATMIVSALRRDEAHSTGDVIAFVPGFAEIVKLEQLVSQKTQEGIYGFTRGEIVNVKIWKVHSETIDDAAEEVIWDETAVHDEKLLVLASKIAAKSVTLPSLKYAFLHPKARDKVLHSSGRERLWDEWIDPELANQESGRVARVSPGLVTFHGLIDDSFLALRALEHEFGHRPGNRWLDVDRVEIMWTLLQLSVAHLSSVPASGRCLGDPCMLFKEASRHREARPFLTVVCGVPDRLPLVMDTIKHLDARGFPFLFWLRTPGPTELDEVSKISLRPKARVMLFWRTTVLPCVKKLAEMTGCEDFFICEDNVALADGVDFSMVAACVQAPASVWGYGSFRRSPQRQFPSWHGTKGLYVVTRPTLDLTRHPVPGTIFFSCLEGFGAGRAAALFLLSISWFFERKPPQAWTSLLVCVLSFHGTRRQWVHLRRNPVFPHPARLKLQEGFFSALCQHQDFQNRNQR